MEHVEAPRLEVPIGPLGVQEYLPGAAAAGHVFCASVVLTLSMFLVMGTWELKTRLGVVFLFSNQVPTACVPNSISCSKLSTNWKEVTPMSSVKPQETQGSV